jgi:hypothetical protein
VALANELRGRAALRTRATSAAIRVTATATALPGCVARAEPEAPFFIYGVYRERWAEVLAAAIRGAGRQLAGCELWALDSPADPLREWTRGSGPGLKFDLLNKLMSAAGPPAGAHVIISDDDYRFATGGFGSLVAVAENAKLDLAQPAHMPRSYYSHAITVARPFTIARLTGTVEIGPVVVIGRAAVGAVLPFPVDAGMGWGLETLWSSQRLMCGVVDAVPILHLGRVAEAYDQDVARAGRVELLTRRGFSNEGPPWVDGPSWRLTRRRPSWISRQRYVR